MRPRTAPSGILVSKRRSAEFVDVCADAALGKSQSIAAAIGVTTNGRRLRQGKTAWIDAPSMRNPLDKTRAAQTLDGSRLKGSLRFPLAFRLEPSKLLHKRDQPPRLSQRLRC